MAIDRTALIQALEQHGTVVFCDNHLDMYYLIVMNNWDLDIVGFNAIADSYILPEYPEQVVISLVDGILKTQYN